MIRVMVVDDASATRNALARLLVREGYEATTACNGVEALDEVRMHRPDLVLLDINMPKMDGLEMLEHLHSDPSLRSLPVVMMTALSDSDAIFRARQLGAKSYLVKAAFSLDEMLSTVKRYTADLVH